MNQKTVGLFLAVLLPLAAHAQEPNSYRCTHGDLTRRVEIVSSAYALNADHLDGLDSRDFAMDVHGHPRRDLQSYWPGRADAHGRVPWNGSVHRGQSLHERR